MLGKLFRSVSLQVSSSNLNSASNALSVLHSGNGNAAYFRRNGSAPNKAAVFAENYGTDGYAGIFQNIDSMNNSAALFAEAVGAGPSIWANKAMNEMGPAANFTLDEATNGSNAVQISNSGSGAAMFINNNNAASTAPSVEINSNSTGGAFKVMNNGSIGYAALLENLNGENTDATLLINTTGPGNAISANATISAPTFSGSFVGDGSQLTNVNLNFPYSHISGNGATLFDISNSGVGNAARFENNGGGTALQVELNGTGTALSASATAGITGIFSSAAANPESTVEITNNGDGRSLIINHNTSGSLNNALEINNFGERNGLRINNAGTDAAATVINSNTSMGPGGFFYITGATNPAYALQGRNDGMGSAGEFLINNASNGSTALNVSTNGLGAGVTINQTNGGIGLDLQSGGLKLPVLTVNTTSTIPDNAVVVEATAAVTLTLPTGGQIGQILYVLNNSAGTVAIAGGLSINPNGSIIYIRVSGSWFQLIGVDTFAP